MSKMSELSLAVAELHKCGEALVAISETLTELFSNQDEAPATQHQPELAQPEPEPKVPTLEEVRAVLARKSIEGYTAEVQALVKKHGADKLSQVNPTHFASLLVEAEALGNG